VCDCDGRAQKSRFAAEREQTLVSVQKPDGYNPSIPFRDQPCWVWLFDSYEQCQVVGYMLGERTTSITVGQPGYDAIIVSRRGEVRIVNSTRFCYGKAPAAPTPASEPAANQAGEEVVVFLGSSEFEPAVAAAREQE
jgi:hypothetical protein